jgi:hypothetical protein
MDELFWAAAITDSCQKLPGHHCAVCADSAGGTHIDLRTMSGKLALALSNALAAASAAPRNTPARVQLL